MKLRYLFLLLLFFAIRSIGFCQDYEITKLRFNTPNNEIAPVISGDRLIYSSNKKSSILINYTDQDRNPLYHLYFVKKNNEGQWSKPMPFAPEIASSFNDGSITISQDGKTLIMTKNQITTYNKRRKTSRKGNLLGLYVSELMDNNKWTKPEAFDFNSKRKFSCGQPCLTPDGNTLFFVTDDRDGFGETDIYFSEKKNGQWGEPQNLGSVINTDGKEIFPFYHPSGKLYFASDGHGGNGGLDIFYTQKLDTWLKPVALEAPINSNKDDYGYNSLENEDEAYFSSNRNGNDDIFRIERTFPTFNECKPQEEDNFCFTLFENGPFDSDTLPYKYRWDFGDETSAFGLEVDHCFPGPGFYNISLNVEDTLAKVDLFTVAQYELPLEKKEQVYITCPDTAKISSLITFNANKSHFSSFKPSEFYWDFGDESKEKGKITTHIYNKAGTYIITCGAISGENKNHKLCSTYQITITE